MPPDAPPLPLWTPARGPSRAARASSIGPAPTRSEGGPGPAETEYDRLVIGVQISAEMQRIQDLLVGAAAGPAPREVEGDEVAALVRQLQMSLLRHPAAAQAAFAALVAEGRRYAETEEGARWREALARSELVRRLRPVYESITLHMFEADPQTTLPSAYLDALVQVARADHLERALTRLQGLGAE